MNPRATTAGRGPHADPFGSAHEKKNYFLTVDTMDIAQFHP